jgi:ATP-dependent protease ClpP protease subunit
MKLFNLRKDKTALLSFKAFTNSGELTLEVYDVIGADFFGNGITVNSVSDALQSAGDFSSVKLRINSPGGDLFQGVAIYNYLRSLGKPINVVVDGLAASAASLIAMAGDKREMGDGAMMMIHNAMMIAMGNAKLHSRSNRTEWMTATTATSTWSSRSLATRSTASKVLRSRT